MKQTLALLLTGITITSFAQSPAGTISGTVLDGSQKTIASATISLLHAKDSSVVKFSVADKTGHYAFSDVPSGKYLVAVTATGHSKGFSEVVEMENEKNPVVVNPIELVPLAKALDGVTVTARKPFIEQKIDKTIVNVDAAVSNAGATALEVLEKSPGVTVDKDGNISLKGKQGIMVMMDGRPSYLNGTELTNYLKNLPASALDQIEIMTNPSAKYDAAGNAGIINIKTKKNKQKGFNGNLSVNYGQGKYWKSNSSLNLNYRTGKVNLFANVNEGHWNGFQRLEIHRRFKDETSKEVTAIFDQVSHMQNHNKNYNLKLGMDYYLNPKTTLGIVTSGFSNHGKFSNRNTSYLQNQNAQTDSIVYTLSNNSDKWKNKSVNLNLRHQFDSAGREFTTDLDYISYQSANNQNYSNNVFDPLWIKRGQEELRGYLPVDIAIYSGKADYAQPLKKGAKLEAGLKTSYVKTLNDANYYTVAGASETPDYRKTNHFSYEENIDAAYVNVNRQFKKVGVQAGLRYEYTVYKGKQFGNPTQTDSSFTNNYGNLFPTLFVSYQADSSNQFAFSYGRRINRPAYQDLNPFLFFIDNYTYQQGNPFLKPAYTHNLEVSHTFKSILTTTVNFSSTKDLNTETFQQGVSVNGSDNYATIVKRGNIGRRNAAGLSVSAQVPVKKWWTAILYSNYNYNSFKGTINGTEEINISAANLMMNINNQFKFEKGWSAELSGFYRTKGLEGQIIIQPMGQLSAGLSKQILKGKGTMKMNVRDLLYTNFPKGDINFQGTEAHFENRRDSRVVNLTFTYRFGKPIKGLQQRKKIGGADEEQNRVKMGN